MTTFLNQKRKCSALVTEGIWAEGNGKSMIEPISERSYKLFLWYDLLFHNYTVRKIALEVSRRD